MKNSLRLTSVVIFLSGTCLLTPKIVDPAAAIGSNTTDHQGSKNPQLTSQVARQVFLVTYSAGDYQPPDNGGPDSHHGSGTR